MTLRQYLITMLFATILCWTAWVFVLINVDPFQGMAAGFIFFYLSLFLALIGTISLLAFFVYRIFDKNSLPMFRYVQLSFRQSVLFSLFLVVVLYLQGKEWLSLWTGLLLVALFILFISFSISIKKAN